MSNTSATGGALVPTATTSRERTEDVLHGLIVGLTGLPGSLLRPRWQSKTPTLPGPDVTWGAFGITSRDMPNFPQVVQLDDDRAQVLVHETLQVLVSFYGPGAEDMAVLLRDALHVSQNREPLYRQGMAFVQAGSVISVPELVAMRWISRVDIPLTFRRGPAAPGRGEEGQRERVISIHTILDVPLCSGHGVTDKE